MAIASEKITWHLFIEGDKSSFEELMKFFFRPLFNYGYKFIKDEELVKDAIQELFIRLWNSRERLSANVHPKAYLFASLRRALYRKIKSQSKTVFFDNEDGAYTFDLEASADYRIITNETNVRIAKTIAANLSRLPKRQKEVVYLKFFQGLSRDDISDAMSISPQTVSNLLQLALKKLRAEFEMQKFSRFITLALALQLAAAQL